MTCSQDSRGKVCDLHLQPCDISLLYHSIGVLSTLFALILQLLQFLESFRHHFSKS
jgi:hypothetical protein